jgi:hypothetical protein
MSDTAEPELNFDVEKLPDVQDIGKKEEPVVEDTPSPEEAVEKLKAEIARKDEELKAANERNARIEKERGEAVASGATAQEQAIKAHEQNIERAIEIENTRLETIERKMTEAQETGNIKELVAQQKELTKASLALANAEQAKTNFEIWKQNEAAKPKQAAPKFTPETQKWIDSHPEFNTNSVYRAEAMAADTAAQNQGYAPDTPAYFNFIDARLAKIFGDGNNAEPEPNRSTTKKQPIPSAAPSRDSVATGKTKNWKDIDLTPAQREAAEISGVSEDDYKKYLLQTKKQGAR